MGSSGEDPNTGIDTSVGGLVWVRRRNGSWWPGRVLGLDELPEGCLPTPRLGTPVKLLGREDASVDWYNLEKSKRVKAFRCPEYNDVIEKAKASSSSLYKKTVKYARREDAILHALELESARLGPDQQDVSTNHVEDSPSSSLPNEKDEDEEEEEQEEEEEEEDRENKDLSNAENDSDSAPELSRSGVSFEETKKWTKTPNDSEEDGTIGVKRMKGLEDIGTNIASRLNRKQSQVARVNEFVKRKSRRRAMTKVLESSIAVSSVPVSETSDSKKNNSDITGLTCENATNTMQNVKDTRLEIPEIESLEELFNVPLVSEEKNNAGLSVSIGKEEHNESGSTSSGTAVDVHNISQSLEKGTSEWQLKGKRNSRSRKIDIEDEDGVGGSHNKDGEDGYHVKSKSITEIQTGWRWNAHTRGSTAAPQRLLPFRQSRFTVNPKYDSSDFPLRHHVMNSGLYDVPVEMKMSSKPQKVPCISLMSKLNGRPIIGHPLTIEVLEYGSSDDLLISSYELDQSIYVREPQGIKSPKSRRNGQLSKKTRKLSSLTGLNRQRQEEKKPIIEELKAPAAAVVQCVPIKLVFSRINAALNSPMRFAPRVTSTDSI